MKACSLKLLSHNGHLYVFGSKFIWVLLWLGSFCVYLEPILLEFLIRRIHGFFHLEILLFGLPFQSEKFPELVLNPCLELWREVRLKHAYYLTCTDVVKDQNSGEILEVHCRYDPDTRGGWSEDGRKVRGTLHWVSAEHALDAEVRLYDVLFAKENPDEVSEGGSFTENINPDSLEVLQGVKVEPSLAHAEIGAGYQFLRQGYFCVDPDSGAEQLIFNRTVTLRDSWAKIEKTLKGTEASGG